MDLNKFTQKAQEAVLASQRLAEELNHQAIEPSHLLLALLRQADGVVPAVVSAVGPNPNTLAAEVERELASRPKVYGGST